MNIDELVSAIREEVPRRNPCTAEFLMEKFRVERRDAVEALKQLSMEGLGRFVPGRGSFNTRLEWRISPHSDYQSGSKSPPFQQDGNQRKYLDHTFPLDASSDAFLRLPRDMSEAEAERIINYVRSLAVKG